jgi:LuxR family maltose regulon positive regulatory protein
MLTEAAPRNTQIPFVSGVIERPRLLAQIQAASIHKLILICAPPGFGKTTIAAQFAHHATMPVAWHTLEDRERDIPNLYRRMMSILEECVPGIHPTPAGQIYTSTERAAMITDYLRANTPSGIIYILDDIHLLAGSPPAEAFLQTLVELLPTNCHLILIGRVLPNLPLTEMIARREVVAYGQDALRFTPDEISRLAAETTGTVLSKAEIDKLASRLEGWPAGTVLALNPLPTDLEQMMLSGGRGPEALFNALARSMLDLQPPGLRDFLLASSTFSRMTPELCSTVLELPDSLHWLREAQHRNLFLSSTSGGLVYHRLFRNFLQSQLHSDNLTLFTSLHAKAAHWLEEHDRLDDSFDHYMIAGFTERATTIAERVADAFFAQGHVETLLEWHMRLRDLDLVTPRLLYNCARIYTDRYNYEEAEETLNEAELGFTEIQNENGAANVQLQRAFILLQKGRFRSAISEAAAFMGDPRDTKSLRGRALNIIGVAHIHLGEVKVAVEYLEQALRIHRIDKDAHALANLLQDLGVAYSRQGRLSDASACLQEVVALRRSLGSPGTVAAALNNLGYYYHLGNNYEQALSTFQEGLGIVAAVPNKRVESALLWSMGDVRRDQGAFQESIRLYNRALGLVGNSEPSQRCGVLISSATLRRWENNYQESASLAERALALAETHEIALMVASAKAALWAARGHMGEAAAAQTQLETVIGDLRAQGARLKLVWVYALSAHLTLLLSDRRGADDYIDLALSEARQGGSAQSLVAEIEHSPLLKFHIVTHPDKYRELLVMLKKLQGVHENITNADIGTPKTYSVRIMTLGVERIECDGTPITPTEWRSSAARELFLYLLFNGPESRERLSLAFWPDSPAKQVRSIFHTTLYRARQALGENAILFQDGVYYISPELNLWCDALELENFTRQARLLPLRDARTENLWRKAIDLYHGDFLPGWDVDWALYRRQSLLEAYLEALMGAGNCARARQDFRDAITSFRRVLDMDPFLEDAHRAIMLCFADLGEKHQVLAHFQRMQDLFQEELGLDPSEETLELADDLLK